MTKLDADTRIPPGMVLVPDNDWAFMARVTAFPEDKKARFYAAIEILFFNQGDSKCLAR